MFETHQDATPTRCPHHDLERRVVTQIFFTREYADEADVCRTCGQPTWTPEARLRFNAWILGLRRERRDVFQVQFYLSEGVRHGLADLIGEYPGATPSSLIRVLTSVYLAAHRRRPDFPKLLARVAARPVFQTTAFGRRRKTSVQFSPTTLLDIQRWGRETNRRAHRIVEDAVYHLVAFSAEAEPELHATWRDELAPALAAILRAL